jgi:adenylyltransferase/sulfurtransferase
MNSSADSNHAANALTSSPTYEQLQEENRLLRLQIQQLHRQTALSIPSSSVTAQSTAAAAVTDISSMASEHVTPAVNAAGDITRHSSSSSVWSHGLSPAQIERYSRQLILSELGGADTQARLLRSRVLVVGAGGLGAPVILYLAAAGVGALTVVDGDEVELSNLHRQIIHTENKIGIHKAISAAHAVHELNPDCHVRPICERFTEANALSLAAECDVLVDASDNVATRYLVNDVGIILSKPVVSGSALRMEGQISIFGLDRINSPCYRCLYPRPPPPASVTNCSDGGVLGAITGIIGSIQAMETIKILAGIVQTNTQQAQQPLLQLPLSASSSNFSPVAAASNMTSLSSKLLLFDGSSCSFRSVRLRPRNAKECAVCGDHPSITKETLEKQSLDYQLFCGSTNHDGPNNSTTNIQLSQGKVPTASVTQLRDAFKPGQIVSSSSSTDTSIPPPLLLDVREPVQFRICALPGAINVPLRVLKQEFPTWLRQMISPADSSSGSTNLSAVVQSITPHPADTNATITASSAVSMQPPREIFVMCRRGVDSVTATRLLLAHAAATISQPAAATASAQTIPSTISIRHVSGGLQAWHDQVDASFPLY